MFRSILIGLFFLALVSPSMAVAEFTPAKPGTFPQEISHHYAEADGLPGGVPNSVYLNDDGQVVAAFDNGDAQFVAGKWSKVTSSETPAVIAKAIKKSGLKESAIRQTALRSNGNVLIAAASGLFEVYTSGKSIQLQFADDLGRAWAVSNVLGVDEDAQGRIWVATLAGVVCADGEHVQTFTGAEGLPYNDFNCVHAGQDGSVWFGTSLGAIRYQNGQWAYRQGKRWLPGDDVQSIVVDAQGDTWFATDGGVGHIEARSMTLAEKAAYYEYEIEKYIKRTPFGYTCEISFTEAGNRDSEVIYHDSDNDGLWTSMYGAGECFAYGATKDPKAKERADAAFKALEFLQTVSTSGSHPAPKGHVARTIRAVEDGDPNIGRIERDRDHQATRDSLWKIYEPRWPKSEDGKWYWKSDTSSDELDGHYFFYPLYYDLVAETEAEKAAVVKVVRELTDHLIEYGYTLVDHTGTPTRWSIYDPENLNNNKMWWSERGLKSLSMLSYLAVAEHMTGDPKYGKHIKYLMEEHGYHTNAMMAKFHHGMGAGNQSDDEMAIMCYYNLMKYTKDPALKEMIGFSFYSYWMLMEPEMNPLFNFACASQNLDKTYVSPWGESSVAPWDGWLEDSMATLTRFPLDRLNWASKNSHRLDIQMLPRQTRVEPDSTAEDFLATNRGKRVNGKVLSVENRHFNHWNTDPWRLDYGGSGTQLGNGTVFLLPYYMGLYHGFIEE